MIGLIIMNGYQENCQICGKTGLDLVLSLGHQPIVQEYRSTHTQVGGLNEPIISYPLNICFCRNCSLVQLDCIVDPKLVFPSNYPYRTGLTNMLIRNFENLAENLFKNGYAKAGELIVDIGSNDGTLLKSFKKRGMEVVGIEPTKAAKVANKNGIQTIESFFDKQTVEKIIKKYGQAKIITATNVFAHINNVSELVKNIGKLLAKDGIFVSESQYLLDIVKNNEFDTIYHEHLRFYSLKSLQYLFKLGGMSIIDAEHITAAGGSIRVYTKKGKHTPTKRLTELIREEKKAGLYSISDLQKFGEQAVRTKQSLINLLSGLKLKDKKIYGLGSPARGNTLLNFCHIDTSLVDVLCEKSGSPKIGLYAPGSHIPIADESKLFTDKPDYLLIVSWHIGDELMRIMRKLGFKGKFIMPQPTPKIIS